jgi:uncharacterized membrane protein
MSPLSAEQAVEEDRKIDLVISDILRAGVIISSLLVLVGGAALLAERWHQPFVESTYDLQLRSIGGIFSLVSTGKPEGIIQLGILVLLSTPFIRVAFAAVAFLRQRDYVYVVIALIVLAGLGYSLLFTEGHG